MRSPDDTRFSGAVVRGDGQAPAIEVSHLTKRYGSTLALDDVSFDVPVGAVFGYLGPNGAGKSTTIRTLMGLVRPTAGRARALGHDVVRESMRVHERVGYLPGDFVAYPDLTARQYLSYLANLRRLAGLAAAEALAERLDLDLDRRIGKLSHGNRQKVGIVQAFMHEPELLVLDEPTSGLDPLMQHEFLALVREARDDGRTVLLSSHVLSEVEAVADRVGFIRSGRLQLVATVDELKARARRRVDLTFSDDRPLAELRAAAGVVDVVEIDGGVRVIVEGSMAELLRAAAPHGIERIVSDETDLEDLFMRYADDERADRAPRAVSEAVGV
jgi:ABC-2 type transport system ATP-binding protein